MGCLCRRRIGWHSSWIFVLGSLPASDLVDFSGGWGVNRRERKQKKRRFQLSYNKTRALYIFSSTTVLTFCYSNFQFSVLVFSFQQYPNGPYILHRFIYFRSFEGLWNLAPLVCNWRTIDMLYTNRNTLDFLRGFGQYLAIYTTIFKK